MTCEKGTKYLDTEKKHAAMQSVCVNGRHEGVEYSSG